LEVRVLPEEPNLFLLQSLRVGDLGFVAIR
jgi:hypothetical protein